MMLVVVVASRLVLAFFVSGTSFVLLLGTRKHRIRERERNRQTDRHRGRERENFSAATIAAACTVQWNVISGGRKSGNEEL